MGALTEELLGEPQCPPRPRSIARSGVTAVLAAASSSGRSASRSARSAARSRIPITPAPIDRAR